jgi:anti-sigma factor RsiW
MNNPDRNDVNELITRALRGQLTDVERAELDRRLQVDHTLRETYDAEAGLEHLLDRVPNIPVSSNFTSLVLQVVRQEQRHRAGSATPWRRFRFARLATGLAVVAVAGVLSIQQYRKAERQEMVRSVASFTDMAAVMSPEQKPGLVFQDFEAIQRLTVPSESDLDLELLVALQK